MSDTKQCRVCSTLQPIANFQHHQGMRDGRKNECRECCRIYNRAREVLNGHIPHTKNRSCSWFLGVHVAERLLEQVFVNVKRMPNNHNKYDFICGKGYKVDVKSSCRLYQSGTGKYPHWTFTIKHNTVADYFACIAIDNLRDLNPVHFWLIPGCIVNSKHAVVISESKTDIWSEYEKPIGKLIESCNTLKVVV